LAQLRNCARRLWRRQHCLRVGRGCRSNPVVAVEPRRFFDQVRLDRNVEAVRRRRDDKIIAVASWERFKGGQRLEFLCGGRALGRWRSFRNTIASSVRLLSVLPEEIPATVERMQGDAREQKRAAAAWQTELATFRARELAEAAESIDGTSAVLRAVDADANGLKALATAVAAASHSVVVLVSTTRPALVVAARSPDAAVSAQQIIATLTGQFGGRGGGKPELAQAGGLDASAEEILSAARVFIVSS
jgi:alanyl-tRNA synthetase